jgi:Ca2+-binding EF-hand superfamily protein
MKIKLPQGDIDRIFNYLDVSNDGQLSYSEFCNLCEERRRNIDPFQVDE